MTPEIEHGGDYGANRSVQVPAGIEPMVDGEEEKVAPTSLAGNSGHGGNNGNGREAEGSRREEKKKVAFAKDAKDNGDREGPRAKNSNGTAGDGKKVTMYVPKKVVEEENKEHPTTTATTSNAKVAKEVQKNNGDRSEGNATTQQQTARKQTNAAGNGRKATNNDR